MCGIFGFAKKHNSQNDRQIDILRDVLTNLADESSVRGKDSTGFAVMTPDSRRTYKSLSDSSSLVRAEDWNKLIDEVNRDTTIVIGHVRLATHGTVNIRNAHPFTIGEVVGAHNGVIYNYNKLAKSMGKEVEVDSEVIFASLNKNEMNKAFTDIDGDFAVTWVKDSNKVIHLAREYNRPMCVAYWKKAKILFWASTEKIMKQALKRAGLKISISEVEEDKIFTFDTDNFGAKPSFDDVGFYSISQVSTSRYGNYYSTGVNSYNQSFVYDEKFCITCGGEEFKEELCWTHWKEDNGYNSSKYSDVVTPATVSDCGYCGDDKPTVDMEWMYTDFCYVCEDCLELDEAVKCGWCDEYVDIEDIVKSSGFEVCIDCKPSVEIELNKGGSNEQENITLRLTESCPFQV